MKLLTSSCSWSRLIKFQSSTSLSLLLTKQSPTSFQLKVMSLSLLPISSLSLLSRCECQSLNSIIRFTISTDIIRCVYLRWLLRICLQRLGFSFCSRHQQLVFNYALISCYHRENFIFSDYNDCPTFNKTPYDICTYIYSNFRSVLFSTENDELAYENIHSSIFRIVSFQICTIGSQH